MSYPTLFTTPGLRQLAEEVDAERQRQLAKWGVQLHPIVETRDIAIVTHHYYAGRADIWRQVNEERATPSQGSRCITCPGSANGAHTHTAWDGVLLEEVYEALAEDDPVKRRVELVQVMAVCAAMIAADEHAAEAPITTKPEAHACANCEGIDPDTCLMNPNRPPEQCPNSEFDGYGLQCQKEAGHNLCTFEEQPAARVRQDGAEENA